MPYKDGEKRKEYHKEYSKKNKEKLAEYQKEYQKNNKERLKENQKQYQEDNKEKLAEQKKEYRKNNKEQIEEQKKEYREENKEEMAEKNKIYRKNNKEKIAKQQREYYEKNKDKIKETAKRHREKNKDKRRESNRQYSKDRYNNDIFFRLNSNMSSSIRQSLKSNNLSKNGRHWETLVSYTIQELKDHLESLFLPGMTWENKGRIKGVRCWEIDHIIPQSFFVFTSTDDVEFKYLWSLDNLQPLWAEDNREKSNKIISLQ